jgi:hypothetical protein
MMKQNLTTGVILFLLILAACTPDIQVPEATETPALSMAEVAVPSPSSTIAEIETAVPATPAPTATRALIAQTPVMETMSNEAEGWYLYQNESHAYRFSFPPVAVIILYGDDCVRTEMYESGFWLITDAAAPNLPPACQPPLFAADPEAEMIRLAGQTVMAKKQAGPTYRVTLPNGLQLDYGLLPGVDPETVDSQAALAVIGDMVDSLRFTDAVALAVVTPTPIAGGCLDEAPLVNQPPTGKLRVVYELDDQTWEWREETGESALLPTEPENEEVLSADGRFQVSLRQPNEDSYELWLSDADGSNLRLLLPISADELYERYPQIISTQLAFDWVSDTTLISYRFLPEADGLGGFPVQSVGIVDAASGDTWTVLPPDLAWTYQFSEDGQQLIALTDEGIQIINTLDGTVRLDIPLDIVAAYEQGITYTPDEQQLFVYTANGITLVNSTDGTVTEIPLDYAPIGMGHFSLLPPAHWLENGTQFYTVTASDDIWAKDATFTIWLVDTVAASATPLNTFTGSYISIDLSPDRRWVAFWIQNMSNMRKLFLADVHSGEQFLYDELHILEFVGWSPDNTHFLYRSFDDKQPILGHICAEKRPLSEFEIGATQNAKWVDAQRLLVVEGIPESGQPHPLRLVSLDKQSTLIATLTEEYPVFRFYFEQ